MVATGNMMTERIDMVFTFNISLFPSTSDINKDGHLCVGGCDLVQLAGEYGTPLYIFDEKDLRDKCREYIIEFNKYYPGTIVAYASKAFINTALVQIFKEEGLYLDVVSAGEMSIAHASGFPMENIYFHGNNKGPEELKLALQWKVGCIVVDNFHELNLLEKLTQELDLKQNILLRITPGIDPHTHQKISTGNIDSKFGFSRGSRELAVNQALTSSNLRLVGLHHHIGSLIFETLPFQEAITATLSFAAEMKAKNGFILKELNVGGGYAIQYTSDAPNQPARVYAEAIASRIKDECARLKLDLPKLTTEPGRSIVGRAGVALYKVGSIKDIPAVRRYVSVDGGMADNIRPAIYGSKYEAAVANKALAKNEKVVSIAGKFCESGDILINNIKLPPLSSGDLIAVPGCGAYCLAMASNYNASLKPPIILIKEGKARLIRRRETYEDLCRTDVV